MCIFLCIRPTIQVPFEYQTIWHPASLTIWIPTFSVFRSTLYSGDSKSGNIWNLDFLKVEFQTVRFSNGEALAMAIVIVPTIQNPDFIWLLTKLHPSVQILNGSASGFWLPDFRPHWKSGPFATQPLQQFEIQTSPDFRSPLYSFGKNILLVQWYRCVTVFFICRKSIC